MQGHKAHAIMLGFNSPEMIEMAMRSCWVDLPRTLFDPGFPLPNQTKNLQALCATNGWKYSACENLGTAGNWNYAFRFLGRPNFLVGVEPDERSTDPDWIEKAIKVLKADDTIAYVGMGQSHFETLYAHLSLPKFTVADISLKAYSECTGWAMGAFSGKFLEKVGLKGDAQYGNLESMTGKAMKDNGFRWALFDGINSVHLEDDKRYEQWKVKSADRETTLPFADWLLTLATSGS